MDPFDVRLQDDELLDEVELTANLIVAANQSDARCPSPRSTRSSGVLPPKPARGRADARPARQARAGSRRSRSEFATTHTLEAAIAAPAIIGLSRPSAAIGMPTRL